MVVLNRGSGEESASKHIQAVGRIQVVVVVEVRFTFPFWLSPNDWCVGPSHTSNLSYFSFCCTSLNFFSLLLLAGESSMLLRV